MCTLEPVAAKGNTKGLQCSITEYKNVCNFAGFDRYCPVVGSGFGICAMRPVLRLNTKQRMEAIERQRAKIHRQQASNAALTIKVRLWHANLAINAEARAAKFLARQME